MANEHEWTKEMCEMGNLSLIIDFHELPKT